jgi:hypothetical protein
MCAGRGPPPLALLTHPPSDFERMRRRPASSARHSSPRGAGATEREAESSASPSTADRNKAGYTAEQG